MAELIFGYLIALGVGLGCGSYATMPYYRLPNGEACAGKWIGKKSHCTKCDHELRTRDLMPVFNWLITRGKCQFCGYKINPVYFFIEFSTMVLSLLAFHQYGFEGLHFFMIALGLATCMVILTATEFTYRVLPDAVLVVAVMFAFLHTPPEAIADMILVMMYAALIGVFYSSQYEKRMGKPLPNFGLPKLLAVSGLWLPMVTFWVHFLVVLALCGVIAVICKAKKSERPMPFGFAITTSLMFHVLYGDWYKIIF